MSRPDLISLTDITNPLLAMTDEEAVETLTLSCFSTLFTNLLHTSMKTSLKYSWSRKPQRNTLQAYICEPFTKKLEVHIPIEMEKKLILKLKMKNFVEYETPAFSYNPSLILSRSSFSKFGHDKQEYNITVNVIRRFLQ